ncbi:MAG: hypothetical protein FGM54_03890 [Chitinophagaceae bacterium]|nr:hypothetical protein [Chitinophagaceae bacterium]
MMRHSHRAAEQPLFRVAHYLLFGLTVLLYAFLLQKNGLEVGPDSTIYVRGALNLHGGEGYTMGRYFINHFPIGLSLIYAVFMKLVPVTIFQAALILHIIWIALCALLFNALLKSSGIQQPVRLLGMGLLLFSSPFLTMSSKLMTELPATLILLACTWLFVQYRQHVRFRFVVLGIGILLGVGLLLRFAMLGFIGAFALLMLWQAKRHWKVGLVNAMLVALPGMMMMLGYTAIVSRVYGAKSVNRVLLWHPISGENLLGFFREPLSWLIPISNGTSPLNVLIILLVVSLGVYLVKSSQKQTRVSLTMWQRMVHNEWFRIIAIITGTYCLFLVVSISLFDAATSVDIRILGPLSIYFYWGIALLFQRVYSTGKNPRWTYMGLFVLGILFSNAFPFLAKEIYSQPKAFSTPYWKEDAPNIINDTSGVWLKPKRTIYTNAVAFWLMCNDKRVFPLPQEKQEVQGRVNLVFEQEISELLNKVRHDSAQVVYFYNIPSDEPRDNTVYLRQHVRDSTGLLFVPMKAGMIIRAKVARGED